MSDQIPPADELQAIRERRRVDKDREEVLKQLMLSDPSARTGNEYVAEIVVVQKSSTDWVELEKCNPELVAAFTYPRSETRVEMRKIDPETGEIVRLPPRKPSLRTIRVV